MTTRYVSLHCAVRGFLLLFHFFFFNDTATTEIYTLSLHDALPISTMNPEEVGSGTPLVYSKFSPGLMTGCSPTTPRSEEHTSELQSRLHLVCRLLLEKKNKRLLRLELAMHVG